jgi:hypothetical protein
MGFQDLIELESVVTSRLGSMRRDWNVLSSIGCDTSLIVIAIFRIPQQFQMQIGFDAMDVYICDDAALPQGSNTTPSGTHSGRNMPLEITIV